MGLEQYAEQIADQIFDDGFQKGKQDGFQEGQQDGFQKGQQDGLQRGQLVTRRAALLELLEGRFGGDARWAPLCQGDDLGRLQRLFKEALAALDADAFFAAATRG